MTLTSSAESLIHQLRIELGLQSMSLASLEIHFDGQDVPKVTPRLRAIERKRPAPNTLDEYRRPCR